MYDPKDVYNDYGYEDYMFHLKALEHHLFYVMNDIDDLHIGALDIKQMDTLFEFRDLLKILKTGDGEKYE